MVSGESVIVTLTGGLWSPLHFLGVIMRIRDKFGSFSFPGWLFVIVTVLYNEAMLHLWITDGLHFGRFAAVALFALGLGCILSLLTSLLKGRAQKWTIFAICFLISAFWLTEYFVRDSYKVFMTPKLMISGAGGVAQDYMKQVITAVVNGWWRIGALLAPTVLYGIFCRPERVTWTLRGILAAAAIAAYVLGFWVVSSFTPDAPKLKARYEFDEAADCFGLHMAVALETTRGSAAEEEPAFVAAPEAPTFPTEAAPDIPEATEPEIVYGDNVMEALDFAALAESEGNRNIASLHSYVDTLAPTKQNEMTGLFEGKNLILITAEAFSAEVIDPVRTPTLYRMANEGIKFEEYYQPAWGASTTSGEFSNVVGLVPVTGGMCMVEATQQNLFLTLGNQLQELNYWSGAYHNHLHDFYDRNKTHVHLGYDTFKGLYGGLQGVDAVWTESDKQMIDATIGDYIDNQPFSVYYMTVSGHCMYSKHENFQSKKNYHLVEDMDASEAVKCYHAAQLELEFAMEAPIGYLEEAGIADDTLIVIATDHYPYGLERSATWQNTSDYLRELYGVEDYDQFSRDHSALIIWSGALEDMDLCVEGPVYSLDILPTVSNLMGIDYDSRLLVGRDVFSDAPALALWPDYSWKTDKGTYDAKSDTFTPKNGEAVSEEYVDYISSLVSNKITFSRSVQSLNYYNYLAKELGRTR